MAISHSRHPIPVALAHCKSRCVLKVALTLTLYGFWSSLSQMVILRRFGNSCFRSHCSLSKIALLLSAPLVAFGSLHSLDIHEGRWKGCSTGPKTLHRIVWPCLWINAARDVSSWTEPVMLDAGRSTGHLDYTARLMLDSIVDAGQHSGR